MSIFGIFFLFACGSKATDTAESTDTSEPMDTAETAETETETETNDEVDIFGNTFTLSGTEGTVGTDSLSLTFYSSGDSMSIGGLCNDIFGDVTFDSGVMNFTYGGSTDLECSDEESQETNWVIGFLESEPLYEYDGTTLELEGSEATLTFEKNVTEE